MIVILKTKRRLLFTVLSKIFLELIFFQAEIFAALALAFATDFYRVLALQYAHLKQVYSIQNVLLACD